MILEYKCEVCAEYFKIKSSATDRGELNFSEKKIFDECKYCKTEQELNLNEIKAKESKWVRYTYLIALIICIIALSIVYYSITAESLKIHFRRYSFVFGLIIVVPFSVAANLVRSEKNVVKRFNQYYV